MARRGLFCMLAAFLFVFSCATLASAEAFSSALPAYRLYNPWTGEHYFTPALEERSKLLTYGWDDEGVAWWSPESGDAVYRLYNQWSGEHHFTVSYEEYTELADEGWSQEGLAWWSDTEAAVPVYRLFNPYVETDTHHYTTSREEYYELWLEGWVQEGVAWYGMDPEDSPDDDEWSNPAVVDGSVQAVTLKGTLVREEWPTSRTGAGWSAVGYFLQLPSPVTVTYIAGSSTQTATITRLHIASVEQYFEAADEDLSNQFSPVWEPYVGYNVAISGMLCDPMNNHSLATVRFTDPLIVNYAAP